MTEREIPASAPLEVEENPDGIDQFITDLFPQVFESLMGITSLRDELLSKVHILSQQTNSLQFRAHIVKDEDQYEIYYGAIGKSDRAFELRKNPITYKDTQTFESLFCLTDSNQGFFHDLSNNLNKSISASRSIGNVVISSINDVEACEADIDTLSLLRTLADSKVMLLDD